jgi:hypothetical protein
VRIKKGLLERKVAVPDWKTEINGHVEPHKNSLITSGCRVSIVTLQTKSHGALSLSSKKQDNKLCTSKYEVRGMGMAVETKGNLLITDK